MKRMYLNYRAYYFASVIMLLSFMLTTNTLFAATQEIGASLTASPAISLSNAQDMSFEGLDTHQDGVIKLSTDSSSAGSIAISGDESSVVEIFCESEGIVQKAEISITPVSSGNASVCNGSDSPALQVNGNATVFIGGEIKVGNTSLAQASNNPITMDVVYQ